MLLGLQFVIIYRTGYMLVIIFNLYMSTQDAENNIVYNLNFESSIVQ